MQMGVQLLPSPSQPSKCCKNLLHKASHHNSQLQSLCLSQPGDSPLWLCRSTIVYTLSCFAQPQASESSTHAAPACWKISWSVACFVRTSKWLCWRAQPPRCQAKAVNRSVDVAVESYNFIVGHAVLHALSRRLPASPSAARAPHTSSAVSELVKLGRALRRIPDHQRLRVPGADMGTLCS